MNNTTSVMKLCLLWGLVNLLSCAVYPPSGGSQARSFDDKLPGNCESASSEMIPRRKVSQQDLLTALARAPNANKARAELLLTELRAAGCSNAHITKGTLARDRNVLCSLPGESEQTIVVAAHFDKTGRGRGIADNWTGVTLLPRLYAEIAAHKPRHSFLFIGFAEEEATQTGSSAFVKKLTAVESDRFSVMVNLDTLGMSSLLIDPRSSASLTRKMRCVAEQTGLPAGLSGSYSWLSGDWEAFREIGVPFINLHSLSQSRMRVIHSNRDSMRAVNPDDYYNSFVLVRQFLLQQDLSIP